MSLAKSVSFERDPVLLRKDKIVWTPFNESEVPVKHAVISRALVVDDDPFYRDFAAMKIMGVVEGVEVVTAGNFSEACDRLKESMKSSHPIDLVLCDIHLSNTNDGIDFWDYCKNELKLEVPFAFMTALSLPDVVEAMGQHDESPPIITKPILDFEFRDLVHNLVGEDAVNPEVEVEALV